MTPSPDGIVNYLINDFKTPHIIAHTSFVEMERRHDRHDKCSYRHESHHIWRSYSISFMHTSASKLTFRCSFGKSYAECLDMWEEI